MLYALYTIHVLICLFLIMVVLLQQGKGADLSVFGGGGTQTAFGARGAATLLHKLTVFSFVAFIFTTMGIGVLKSGGTSGSVMSDVAVEEPEAAADEAEAEATDAVETLEDLLEESAADEGAAPAGEEGGEADAGGGEDPAG